MVVQILFWILLILAVVIGPPWGAWGERAPNWSNHIVYIILFACLGFTVYGGALLR
jgi:hypothetical protein